MNKKELSQIDSSKISENDNKNNIEIFKKYDFDVWVCKFHSKGIEII